MKIALIGGHMAPALGLLDRIPQTVDVVYIGRKHVFEGDQGTSLEYKTINRKGIRFIPFATGRIQRRFTSQTIASLAKIPQGFLNAFILLKKEKPDIVIGFGGYLSFPIGVAAAALRIPLLVHEQTLGAGLANKMLSPFATKICISWDSSRQYFPEYKTVLTGNPLLPFSTKLPSIVSPVSKESLPILFIAGGSGGSHALNMFILPILPQLLTKFRIIHQTGAAKEFGDYEKLLEEKKHLSKNLQERYVVVQFIDPQDINAVFAKSSVFVGRSGINTVTALLLLKKKSLLIPLPIGQRNEQLENAKLLSSVGLGVILDQNLLSPERLLVEIEKLQKKTIPSEAKWSIPITTIGAENLMKEVVLCARSHRQEK